MDQLNIQHLASLLTASEEDEDSGYVKRSGGAPDTQAASRMVVKSGADMQAAAPAAARAGPTPIWDDDEVHEGAELDDVDDPRPRPEYTMTFRQQVTAEDMFLQVGNKTPATASCEQLVVRVQLPGETRASTVLDVRQRHVDVRAERWRLSLFLPHPVRDKQARAHWDADSETLELVLPVSRELDALNF
ncbi:dynein assembly factor 6, axonemal-like [Pollicipes pollicipes]|uniref:dynein assembly factor 6, axonemal-like n=1 Tax=Pollicipes pollicipes TaxID=41117 RepID=UPI001884AEC1|nr:dynein assembly factor 6, axonemal-like [Pollicipes pollicipes]